MSRNSVYGGTLYWYSDLLPLPSARKTRKFRREDYEFRVVYVGSTTQSDIWARHQQHLAKGHPWAEAAFDEPNTLDVPGDIRLVVAEEAMRLLLRPVYNRRSACGEFGWHEWVKALGYVVADLDRNRWLPENWRGNVCSWPWGSRVSIRICQPECMQPDRCAWPTSRGQG